MNKRKTTEEFINEIFIKFPSNKLKFRYDRVEYVNAHVHVEIYCNECNKYFSQTPNSHLKGQGCSICAIKKRTLNNTKTQEQFIKEAIEKHGDKYGYDKVVYIKSNIEVEIYCKKCKKYFKQKPVNHLQENGCTTCGYKKNGDMTRMLLSEFIKKAKSIHGNDYGYDRVVYVNNHTNVEIYCKKHKKYFKQTPTAHVHQKSGCPICRESQGEKAVRLILEKYDIYFVSQKRFKKCKDKRTLPFDFYLPEYNVCIEYQGEQHYQLIRNLYNKVFTKDESEKEFKKVKFHDSIKNNYCISNNMKLIVIPYWDVDNIENYINTYKRKYTYAR